MDMPLDEADAFVCPTEGDKTKAFPEQLSVFFNLESPTMTPEAWQDAPQYDIIMSYTVSSSAHVPITYFTRDTDPRSNTEYNGKPHDKKYVVSFMAKQCHAHRSKFYKEFSSVLPVHSFGECENNANELQMFPDCSQGGNNWWETKRCVMSKI